MNTEVVIGLPGAAIITNDSAASLEPAESLAASTIFKAGSVIVSVPAWWHRDATFDRA